MISESDPRVSQVGHPGPPWMISYADLMTELVAFFIILYALGAALDKSATDAGKASEDVGKQAGMDVKTEMKKDGVQITIQEQADKPLFASGQASLSGDGEKILRLMAPVLLSFPHEIEVQGHTDNVPVGRSTYASNWELSTARATFVVRTLIDKYGVPAKQLGAIGYGEHRPIATNDTPENRAKNRRVVFFLKTSAMPDKKAKDETSVAPAAPVSSPSVTPTPAPTLAASTVGKTASAFGETMSGSVHATLAAPMTPSPAKPAVKPEPTKLAAPANTLSSYPPGIMR